MLKRIFTAILCLVFMLSIVPMSFAATIIGQDVTQNLPIESHMDSPIEAADINTQISTRSGSASLTQDRVSGNYAVSVSVGDVANQDYIDYLLVSTDPFTIADNSQISLWVKPAAGAKWIKFFTNNSLIMGDENKDGIYSVGQDLVSGEWNQVKLDLTMTQPKTNQGNDLKVQTNDVSTWEFDDVVSNNTTTYSIDLSRTINNKTELINNAIQFKDQSDDTYDTTPTVLVSQKGNSTATNYTQETDWNAMTRDNVDTATTPGDVKLFNSNQNFMQTATNNADFNGTYSNTVAADNGIVLSTASGAGRLYIQNADPSYIPVSNKGDWDATTSVVPRKLSPTKLGNSYTKSIAETSTTTNYDMLFFNCVSDPIPSSRTLSGTLAWCLYADETNTSANSYYHINAYVTQGDSDIVRGTLLDDYIGTAEFGTTGAGTSVTALSITNVAVQTGDRIVIEVGCRHQNTSSTSYGTEFGIGGTGTTDLTNGYAGNDRPGWFEFSNNPFVFNTSGTYTHTEQNIEAAGTANDSYIVFNKTTNAQTAANVEIRVYSNSAWGNWKAVESGYPIVDNGTNLTGYKVQWRVNLSTTDPLVTPSLNDVTISVNGAYRPTGTLTGPVLDNPSHGGVTLSYNATIPPGTNLGLEWRESPDGTVWSNWSPVTNGQTYGSEAKFQFRVNLATTDITTTPALQDVTATLVGGDYNDAPALPQGKISKIFIDSGYNTISESVSTLPLSQIYLTDELPLKISISGDGNIILYQNTQDSYKLYTLNLNNGEKTNVSNSMATDFKSDYDGGRIAYKSNGNLYITGVNESVDSSVGNYVISNEGNVVYSKDSSLILYTNNKNVVYSGNVTDFDITRVGEQIFFSYNTSLKKIINTPVGWKTSELLTTDSDITGLWVNNDGSLVFLEIDDEYYVYEAYSKALRKLGLTASAIAKITDDNKVIAQDTNRNYLSYDPETDQTTNIRPSNAKNPPTSITLYFDVDNTGSHIAYVASQTTTGSPIGVGVNSLQASGSTVVSEQSTTLNGAERPERYLFSFDGKNSWSSYKDGTWVTFNVNKIPDKNDFDQYGMTIDEVNSLTDKDLGYLYENGRQIFNFDVAIYFASVNPYITPSLKGIVVTLSRSGNGFGNELTEKALFAAKEQIFDGTNWRKIRKIYPIELSPKEAELYYFVKVDNVFKSYKDNTWQTVSSSLFDDVESDWIDVTLQGMTAQELRAIPEADLTSLLHGKNFNVVYCMKVLDNSTIQYTSNINIDYVEDLFSSTTLTLKIIYNDGTIKTYTDLTDTEVEDFMQWLSERQFNRGPIYYRIKINNNNDFINYYMVQSVNVTE